MKELTTLKKSLLLRLACPVICILITQCILSNPILAGSAKTVPYDKGYTEMVPSAAARIARVHCSDSPYGKLFTLDIEVFPTCWRPVYCIQFEELEATDLMPVSCPAGWQVGREPSSTLAAPGRTIFQTQTQPILPGQRLTGFALASGAAHMVLRWYPADESGVLIGRVTREVFSCPTAAESQTWGSIKALYR